MNIEELTRLLAPYAARHRPSALNPNLMPNLQLAPGRSVGRPRVPVAPRERLFGNAAQYTEFSEPVTPTARWNPATELSRLPWEDIDPRTRERIRSRQQRRRKKAEEKTTEKINLIQTELKTLDQRRNRGELSMEEFKKQDKKLRSKLAKLRGETVISEAPKKQDRKPPRGGGGSSGSAPMYLSSGPTGFGMFGLR
jgi:hypothetical protein